eukprot:COSAG01_NODE_3921_length_5535_cov_44.878933_1_plen_146_part_00
MPWRRAGLTQPHRAARRGAGRGGPARRHDLAGQADRSNQSSPPAAHSSSGRVWLTATASHEEGRVPRRRAVRAPRSGSARMGISWASPVGEGACVLSPTSMPQLHTRGRLARVEWLALAGVHLAVYTQLQPCLGILITFSQRIWS